MVYELGGYSSNSHFIWYLHGTLPFLTIVWGLLIQAWHFILVLWWTISFWCFFLQNHDQPLTVKHFSLLKLWLSCEEWCSFRKFRSLIGGLEPWNFMTFHRLGIVTPTDKYFSEGWVYHQPVHYLFHWEHVRVDDRTFLAKRKRSPHVRNMVVSAALVTWWSFLSAIQGVSRMDGNWIDVICGLWMSVFHSHDPETPETEAILMEDPNRAVLGMSFTSNMSIISP